MSIQDLSSVQDRSMIGATTLASAATIVPKTKFTRITGTVAIQNITPPTDGYHELIFMIVDDHLGAPVFSTGGNLDMPGVMSTSFGVVVIFYFDPRNKKYYTVGQTTFS